jgi:hypothetical protein
VTVHKSQGSQFGITFVVVPDPCPLLSPELLYTALTRQRERVVVLKQGDAAALRNFAAPARSETARRLTRPFRPADPFTVPEAGIVVDAAHLHVTARKELVRSKSEVIVADTLHRLGVDYGYEVDLRMSDGSWRSPDFTIERPGRQPVYGGAPGDARPARLPRRLGGQAALVRRPGDPAVDGRRRSGRGRSCAQPRGSTAPAQALTRLPARHGVLAGSD